MHYLFLEKQMKNFHNFTRSKNEAFTICDFQVSFIMNFI